MGDAARGVGRICAARAGVVEGVRPPNLGAVIDVAFSDDAHGVAVTEPGLAWFTRGGERWSRLAVEGAALSAAADRDRLWLRTSAAAVVDASGGVTGVDSARVPRIEPLDLDEGRRLADPHEDELAPLAPAAFASADGSLVVAQRAERWGLYDLRDDSWTPLPTLPEACGPELEWLFAGRLHARCGAELHALGDDGRWSLRLSALSNHEHRDQVASHYFLAAFWWDNSRSISDRRTYPHAPAQPLTSETVTQTSRSPQSSAVATTSAVTRAQGAASVCARTPVPERSRAAPRYAGPGQICMIGIADRRSFNVVLGPAP